MQEVELRSDEFGVETFRYDSTDEAEAGARRLVAESEKAFVSDGIEREVVIVGRRWKIPAQMEE